MTETIKTTLVLGGTRSGKSRIAEQLATDQTAKGSKTLYLATAEPFDHEMQTRINVHQSRRGASWETIEEPLDVPGIILMQSRLDRAILVDCLTLWLSNLMHAERDVEAETARLMSALNAASGPVVLVSNEVGQGIVPENALARAFRDLAGSMHQSCAAACDRILFVTAGLVQTLKGPVE